jgi:membrane-associated HD superfamily phosphohydrolase
VTEDVETVDRRLSDRIDALDQRLSDVLAFLNQQIADVRHDGTVMLDNIDKATVKAETAIEKRFDAVNEFRAQLNDQTKTFMPRAEIEARIVQNYERYNELANRVTRAEGKAAGSSAAYGYLTAAITAVIAIVTVVLILVTRAT